MIVFSYLFFLSYLDVEAIMSAFKSCFCMKKYGKRAGLEDPIILASETPCKIKTTVSHSSCTLLESSSYYAARIAKKCIIMCLFY